MSDRAKRRLAAIVAADVAGYSRLIRADEEGTLDVLRTLRRELIGPLLIEHAGRIANTAGDSLLLEFPSAVNAVHFSAAMQESMAARNADVPADQRIEYRIGINVGDVVAEGKDLLGDGVNVAARLEGLAEPGGICVSRAVRDHIRDKLDLEMDDMGEVEVKNIARPVRTFRLLTEPGSERQGRLKTTASRGRLFIVVVAVVVTIGAVFWWQYWTREADQLPRRPSDLPAIAVLPFDNMSGDPNQEYFSDGITDDLITDLSRVSGLFVIARNSVFTYKGTPVKVQQVGRELGVSYVLEGSVRKAGDRVRINAQLVEASTGHHLWADRYDRELTDVFALQDEVVQRIVSALAVELTEQEQVELTQAAKAHPQAYDTLLRGLEELHRYTREGNAEALKLFEKAIALDPGFARAYADSAYVLANRVISGWSQTPDDDIRRANEFAERAQALDDSLPQVYHAISSIALAENRLEASIAAAQRAIELEPNYADWYAVLASQLNYGGRPKEAIKMIQTAMRLNPRYGFFYVWIKGHAHFMMQDYAAAIAEFEDVVKRNPDFPRGRLYLAASYAQSGQIDEARWEANEALALLPDLTIETQRQTAPYKEAADMERYIEGLRKAGIPE